MHRKIVLFVLSLALFIICPITAYAAEFDGNRNGSITVTLLDQYGKEPIEGAVFDVCYIASVGINTDGKLNYIYAQNYKDCGIELDDPELDAKLSDFVEGKNLAFTHITTDKDGVASCGNIPLGLYLVKQVSGPEGYSICSPFVVTVPMQNEAEFVYDVNASPKTDTVKLVDISIKKVWNAGKAVVPFSVSVQLLRNGKVVETATLNKSNNWQVTYTDMPQSDAYEIKEVNVPKGFAATYSQKNYVFTVTNTSALAQTGQLIWPIPVLAAVGMLLLVMGFLLLRRPGENDA